MKELKKSILLILSLMSFWACKTDKNEILGAQIKAASADFKILAPFSVSKKSIVFSVDKPSNKYGWIMKEDSVVVSAEFNEEVTATISIKGLKSGAIRKFRVTAKKLDINNVSWRGEHEGFYFFRKEKALVTYHIEGYKGEIDDDTITIQGPQLYRSGRNFALPSWSLEEYDLPFIPPRNSAYGNDAVKGTHYNESGIETGMDTPNGTRLFRIESSQTQKTGFLNMGHTFELKDVGGKGKYRYFVNSSNPDSVYYNMYIYSPSNKPETKLIVVIGEIDIDKIEFTSGSGTTEKYTKRHDRKNHDRKLLTIPMNFTGWKLFSFRYSNIPFSTNKLYGGNGNKINQPQSATMIDFNLEGEIAGHHVVYVDFPIITYGGPFDPTILK